jgi:ribosomal protein L11 methyltransferase
VTGGPAPRADLTVEVTVPVAEAELAADALWAAGTAAVAERPAAGPAGGPGEVVLAAAPAGGGDPGALLAAVARRWPAVVVAVDLGAAFDGWRDHARAIAVGDRLVVRPLWVPPGPGVGRIDVVVDPGRAFGSGAHASTRLALAAVDRLVAGGETVLDVGCGSGVVALAALALGAATATGVDIDPAALAATAANAERNGLAARLTVGRHIGGRHDLVLANLLLTDHRTVAPAAAAALAPGGTLVATGILVAQVPALAAVYGERGLAPAGEPAVLEGWAEVSLRAR